MAATCNVLFIAIALFLHQAYTCSLDFAPFCREACDACQTCTEKNSTLIADVMQALNELDEAKKTIEKLEAREGLCDVKYEDKCFTVFLACSYTMTYEEAEKICAERNGHLANIYSEEHYTMIMRYLYSKIIPKYDTINVHLGMRFDPSTSFLTFRDGTPATFVHWGTNQPHTTAGSTYMELYQCCSAGCTSYAPGMYNMNDVTWLSGVLCEYD